jgi:hypothetical protein
MSEKTTPRFHKESGRKSKERPPKKPKPKKDRLTGKKHNTKSDQHNTVPNHISNTQPAKGNSTALPLLNLPNPPNLEEEIRAIWSKSIDELPVYKDLPRLARRIVILGSLKSTLSSATISGIPIRK